MILLKTALPNKIGRGNYDDWFCGNTDFKQIGLNMNY